MRPGIKTSDIPQVIVAGWGAGVCPRSQGVPLTDCFLCYYKDPHHTDHVQFSDPRHHSLIPVDTQGLNRICLCGSTTFLIDDTNDDTWCSFCLRVLSREILEWDVFNLYKLHLWGRTTGGIEVEPICVCSGFILKWGAHDPSCRFPAWNQKKLKAKREAEKKREAAK